MGYPRFWYLFCVILVVMFLVFYDLPAWVTRFGGTPAGFKTVAGFTASVFLLIPSLFSLYIVATIHRLKRKRETLGPAAKAGMQVSIAKLEKLNSSWNPWFLAVTMFGFLLLCAAFRMAFP